MVNKSVLIMVASIDLAAGLTTAAKAQGAGGEVVCNPGNVYKPNPSDCGSFYQCSNGTPFLHQCPAGQHFNPNLNVCDWPADAGCKLQ